MGRDDGIPALEGSTLGAEEQHTQQLVEGSDKLTESVSCKVEELEKGLKESEVKRKALFVGVDQDETETRAAAAQESSTDDRLSQIISRLMMVVVQQELSSLIAQNAELQRKLERERQRADAAELKTFVNAVQFKNKAIEFQNMAAALIQVQQRLANIETRPPADNNDVRRAVQAAKVQKPKPYTGERDPALLENWIFRTRHYLNFLSLPADVGLQVAITFLDETALLWWQQREKLGGSGQHEAVTTFEMLAQELRRHYGNPGLIRQSGFNIFFIKCRIRHPKVIRHVFRHLSCFDISFDMSFDITFDNVIG